MKKIWSTFFILVLTSFLTITTSPFLYAQSQESPTISSPEPSSINNFSPSEEDELNLIYANEEQGFPVILGGETLFTIQANFGPVSAERRATEISQKITTIAKNQEISPNEIKIRQKKKNILIYLDDLTILGIIPADANAANLQSTTLANQYLKIIQEKIIKYREERNWKNIGFGFLYAIFYTVVVLLMFRLLNKIFPTLYSFFNAWCETQGNSVCETQGIPSIKFQGLEIISAQQIQDIFINFLKLIRLVLILIILNIYIPLLLRCFPWTKPLSKTVFSKIFGTIFSILETGWQAFFDYLPSLFFIAVVAIITYYIVCFVKLIFDALNEGRISLPGFDPEWSDPTYKIVMFLILIFAIVVIFPYLPGSDSPAIQGLSLLVGALLTLGSTSAISNLVSGFILIYTRAFRVGDRIKVGEITGNVTEKTILSTRILTPNNVLVTVPNASLLSSNILNYNTAIRERQQPLILHTTVTMGYTVPWRTVHQTLIKAAQSTQNILPKPEPRVWQTSLNDFYVSYELRAYTNEPDQMGITYSELHQNVQDSCREAGIEILSPHYKFEEDGEE